MDSVKAFLVIIHTSERVCSATSDPATRKFFVFVFVLSRRSCPRQVCPKGPPKVPPQYNVFGPHQALHQTLYCALVARTIIPSGGLDYFRHFAVAHTTITATMCYRTHAHLVARLFEELLRVGRLVEVQVPAQQLRAQEPVGARGAGEAERSRIHNKSSTYNQDLQE